jgi:hypothetical protein
MKRFNNTPLPVEQETKKTKNSTGDTLAPTDDGISPRAVAQAQTQAQAQAHAQAQAQAQVVAAAAAAAAAPGGVAFRVTTTNVSDLCVVINALSNVPQLDHVLMQFTAEGMLMYGKPGISPVITESFWHKSRFTVYDFPTDPGYVIRKFLNKARLTTLKQNITKSVEVLTITECQDASMSGFAFSGHKTDSRGGNCKFNYNIFEMVDDAEVVDMSTLRLDWHVRTSSDLFRANVGFIDDKSDYVQISLHKDVIAFTGIGDMGFFNERIEHTIESAPLEVHNENLFYKKFLNIVTSAANLHPMLRISFKSGEDGVYPMLFSYELDHQKSHFSIYIMPFNKE